MKVIKKGNIYRKANWFKQNEKEIYIIFCAVLFVIDFILACLIRG